MIQINMKKQKHFLLNRDRRKRRPDRSDVGPKMKTRVVEVHFNPYIRLIWIERLPFPLPHNYTGGRRVRQYRQTAKRTFALHDAAERAGFTWLQDSNGVHLSRFLESNDQ